MSEHGLRFLEIFGEHVHPANAEISQCQVRSGGVSTSNPNQRRSFKVDAGFRQVTGSRFEISEIFVYTGDF